MTKTQEEQYLKAVKSIAKSLATIAKGNTSKIEKDEPRAFTGNISSKSALQVKRLIQRPPFELYFDSREEAEEVLNKLRSMIYKYGFVTVLDLYELRGVVSYAWSSKQLDLIRHYGWNDLNSVKVEWVGIGCKYSSEWKIILPMYFKVCGE